MTTNYTAPPLFLALLLALSACSGMKEGESRKIRKANEKGEFIYRKESESWFAAPKPQYRAKEPYPWQERYESDVPKITKEYFRCKGSSLNAMRLEPSKDPKDPYRYSDCAGGDRHSLYMREGKEFIYPILLDLLNYIQDKTGHAVVITSGYRCPLHNSYVDPSPKNWGSKHMIGAEVDFYVEGYENEPDRIIRLIQQYYLEDPQVKDKKEFTTFTRYSKQEAGLSIQPWMNQEIFIKLYKVNEGRNLDNNHTYPYLSLQVRFDRAKGEKVSFNKKDAESGYLRRL